MSFDIRADGRAGGRAGRIARAGVAGALVLAVAGCGTVGGWFADNDPGSAAPATREMAEMGQRADGSRPNTIWSLFGAGDDPNTTVEVNRYIWNASLEVLNFLPIQSVDPFSGVIVTGFGTPPGGGRSYRATVYVRDPALDARSLTVALQGAGGARWRTRRCARWRMRS
jgi:hypothetical protein